MRVLGFNFKKISAEKSESMDKANQNINFQYTNVTKEKVDFIKEYETYKIDFEHVLTYLKPLEKGKEDKIGELSFTGNIILGFSKEEAKALAKSWKKKEIPQEIRLALSNFILRKCTPKSIQLQDEIGLPFHIAIPRLSRERQV